MLAEPDLPFEFVTRPRLMTWSEEELRHKAALSCARLKPWQRHLALKHVTIIGTQSVDFNRVHTDKDSARLVLALRYLMESGIPLSPDFVVDCVDFRDGRDFLKEKGKTDIVFASYIRGKPSTSSRHYGPGFEMNVAEDFGGTSTNMHQEVKWAYYHAQSPLTERDGWRRRTEQSGAKIFMAFGGNIEVGTRHVVGKSTDAAFATIIANPDITDADVRPRHLSFSYIYPYAKDLDLPMLWLGIAIQKAYGGQIQTIIKEPQTFMAKKTLTLFRKGYADALKPPDVGLVGLWRNMGLLPALRTVFKLEGHDIRLDGLQRKKANAKRDNRPQDGMYP
jgi:hypothetical protein